jgi:hypothetical protein
MRKRARNDIHEPLDKDVREERGGCSPARFQINVNETSVEILRNWSILRNYALYVLMACQNGDEKAAAAEEDASTQVKTL